MSRINPVIACGADKPSCAKFYRTSDGTIEVGSTETRLTTVWSQEELAEAVAFIKGGGLDEFVLDGESAVVVPQLAAV